MLAGVDRVTGAHDRDAYEVAASIEPERVTFRRLVKAHCCARVAHVEVEHISTLVVHHVIENDVSNAHGAHGMLLRRNAVTTRLPSSLPRTTTFSQSARLPSGGRLSTRPHRPSVRLGAWSAPDPRSRSRARSRSA